MSMEKMATSGVAPTRLVLSSSDGRMAKSSQMKYPQGMRIDTMDSSPSDLPERGWNGQSALSSSGSAEHERDRLR